jgi:hypothetical protein
MKALSILGHQKQADFQDKTCERCRMILLWEQLCDFTKDRFHHRPQPLFVAIKGRCIAELRSFRISGLHDAAWHKSQIINETAYGQMYGRTSVFPSFRLLCHNKRL